MVRSRMLLIGLLSGTMFLVGCHQPPIDRAGRLLGMAGEEAAGISSAQDRFTRQLNVAHTQVRTGRRQDAVKTLELARNTLATSKKEDFDDFHRIAGWTAISQLARQADDRALALISSDLALAALNDVMPVAERPQYVLSLAAELGNLRGKEAAIELLISGGGWAAEMHDTPIRRAALLAFTNALLEYNAFDAIRTTLRRDPDVSWRTDTMLMFANLYAGMHSRSANGGGFAAAGASGAYLNPRSSANFGKDVRFENVYQQKQ